MSEEPGAILSINIIRVRKTAYRQCKTTSMGQDLEDRY